MHWDHLLQLGFTALVYAPVAVIVCSIRQFAVAVIAAGLSISSGLMALVILLQKVRPIAGFDVFGAVVSLAMHLSELAALGMLLWLLGRHRLRGLGVAMSCAAMTLAVSLALLGWLGASVPAALQQVPLMIAVLSFALGAVVTLVGWWRGGEVERIVAAWFVAGAVLMVLSYLDAVPGVPAPAAGLSTAAFLVAQSLLPTALLAALFGGSGAIIDRRLVTGIVWAQALGSAIGLYVLVEAVARALGAPATVAGALAAALLALAFSFMIGVFRSLTGLVFFGPGISVRRVLSHLGDVRLGPREGGVEAIAEALREAWHLRVVSIVPAGEPGEPEREVASAEPDGALEYRLVSRGAFVGTMHCTAENSRVLTNVVAPMLGRIGGLIAVAVQLASANHDLAALQQRARGIRHEERRLMHRELHDELAPALTGIGFGIAGAKRLIDSGSAQAPAALKLLQRETTETADRVRRLARALLPAALDAGDLDAALRELAARFSGPGFEVIARAPGTDELEGETQIAVYLMLADVVEACARAQGAAGLHIEAELRPGSVRTVLRPLHDERTDAGCAQPPIGFDELQRRCAEAGGTLVRLPAEDAFELVMLR